MQFVEIRLTESNVKGFVKREYLRPVAGAGPSSIAPTTSSKQVQRWMVHERAAGDTVRETALRASPAADGGDVFLEAPLNHLSAEVINGEVVEVLVWKELTATPPEVCATGIHDAADARVRLPAIDGDPWRALQFIMVKLALSGAEGYLRFAYLRACPEGTNQPHGFAAGENRTVERVPLAPSSGRYQEIAHRIRSTWHTHASSGSSPQVGDFPPCASCLSKYSSVVQPWAVASIEHVTGQFLGASGLYSGPKVTLFHGTKDAHLGLDSNSEGILSKGFDERIAQGESRPP